jgi:hypothetical protein
MEFAHIEEALLLYTRGFLLSIIIGDGETEGAAIVNQ